MSEASGDLDEITRRLGEALDLARQAEAMDEVPVGALILSGNQVVGSGFNRRESEQDPLAHAEMLAIESAARTLKSWRLTGCTLYVTLEPCPMCLAACQQARIARVVYGATDPKGGALSLGCRLHEDVRANHRFEVVHRPSAGCGEILSRYFQKKRAGARPV